MKLEELVPPLELCKLIPKGEFEDTAFIYMEVIASSTHTKTWSIMGGTPYAKNRPNTRYPAPTLEEIMAKLPSCVCYRMNKEWSVGLVNDSAENAIKDSSGAAAALKLWLELKGIEYEK